MDDDRFDGERKKERKKERRGERGAFGSFFFRDAGGQKGSAFERVISNYFFFPILERENEIKSETQTMPPKKRKKNETNGKTEAQDAVLEEEEIVRGRQVSTKIYQSALSSRIVSSTLPSTAEVIQTRNRQLFKSDAKDIVKKANTRKSRHMVVFPGQFAQISLNTSGDTTTNNNNALEFGELADLDTQNPVCYINFPNGIGKMKLFGTIARARESRYFTLNVGQSGGSSKKDSGNNNATANLEDFFDGVLIFSQWAWIGTKEENPEEKPLLEIPESVWKTMNSGNKKTAIDWERKNNTTTGGKKKGGKTGDENDDTNTADDSVITLDDSDDDEGGEGGKDKKAKDGGGRRPKRQAAAKAEKNLADNDGLGNIDFDKDDDSDSDDGRIKSPQALVRGKATMSIISPIQPSIAGREVSLRSPGGGGGNGSGGGAKKKATNKAAAAAAAKKKSQQQKKKKFENRLELSDSDSDDVMDLISSDDSSEDDEPIAKKARPARRSSAAATKTYKENSDDDDDDDDDVMEEDESEEEEESDFDDDSDFE